jgi:hypothetical protein
MPIEEQLAGTDGLRLLGLLNAAEPRVQRRFLELIDAQREIANLERIADLLERGDFTAALSQLDEASGALSTTLEGVFAAAGLSAAELLRADTDTLIEFNQLNQRAVFSLQETRARLIRELSFQQQQATLAALVNAQVRGATLFEQARAIRDSIGLTAVQQQAVDSYRRALEAGNADALARALRDRRFDGTVARAVSGDITLSTAQIDRMVERYRQRSLAHRAETIARTESLAAIHAGDEEMWQQAIDDGIVTEESFVNQWVTVGDARVRDSHSSMNGQRREFKDPFISGNGARLRFPGDPRAPASEVVHCRCVLARTLSRTV